MGNNLSSDEKYRVEIKQLEIKAIEERIKRENEAARRENTLAEERMKLDKYLAEEKIKIDKSLASQVTPQQIFVVVSVATISLLTFDFIAHGFRPFLKLRLKWSLRKAPPPLNTSKFLSCDTSRAIFADHVKEMNLPTLLIGPTGCGKSTLLLSTMNEYFNTGLGFVKFISIRTNEQASTNTNSRSKSKEVPIKDGDKMVKYNGVATIVQDSEDIDEVYSVNSAAFDNATKGILRSINYPTRPPLISLLWPRITSITLRSEGSTSMRLEDKNSNNTKLLENGLSLLVECAADLGSKSGKPTLLVFDELHDLVRLDRLRSVGGWSVFHVLANHATMYGVNARHVRFVFASSSSALSHCFQDTNLKASRRFDKCIEDYPQHELVEFLFTEYGILRECSTRFTDVVGCRLRLVMKVLNTKNIPSRVEKLIEDELRTLDSIVSPIMTHPVSAKYLSDICDGIEVSVKNVPSDIMSMKNFSSVFYVGDSKLAFQNNLVKYVWIHTYQESYRKKLADKI